MRWEQPVEPMQPNWARGMAAGVLLLCLLPAAFAQEAARLPREVGGPDDASLPRARRAEPLPSYTVEVTDGVFTPRALNIPAGKRVKVELVNHGPGPLEFENDEMNIEKVLGAGARSFVVLPPLVPGTHEFVDEFNPVTGVLVIHAR